MQVNFNKYNNQFGSIDSAYKSNEQVDNGIYGTTNSADNKQLDVKDIYSQDNKQINLENSNYSSILKSPNQTKKSPETQKSNAKQTSKDSKTDSKLSPAEEEQLNKLKEVDAKVKQHEAAHLAAAGSLATGGATYTYQTGPDGKQYAVGGEVQISLSGSDNPDETIRNMQTAQRAALAPSDPSGQDRSVAQQAAKLEAQASSEKSSSKNEDKNTKDTSISDTSKKETNITGNDMLNPKVSDDKINPFDKNAQKQKNQNEIYSKVISKYIQSTGSIPLGKNIYSFA